MRCATNNTPVNYHSVCRKVSKRTGKAPARNDQTHISPFEISFGQFQIKEYTRSSNQVTHIFV